MNTVRVRPFDQFDSRPHQEGVVHGPYLPLGDVGIFGFDECINQLHRHQDSIDEASEKVENPITSESHRILGNGIGRVINMIYKWEYEVANNQDEAEVAVK